MSWPELRNGGNRAETVLAATGGLLPMAPRALAYIAPEIFSSLEAAKKWLHRTNLDTALVRHADHLTRIHVRPSGQRGAPWPLLVDRRQHPCLLSARSAFETMMDTAMAIWVVV
jgi:hypothetical protein